MHVMVMLSLQVMDLELCTVLLMDDATYPCWLVLVPRKVQTQKEERSGTLALIKLYGSTDMHAHLLILVRTESGALSARVVVN